jgi:signal transduction histidine kinase
MFGINFDITERKRFEQTLQEINQRFATASTAAGLGFWEWNVKDSTFVADETAFRLFGRQMPKSHQEAWAAWTGALHPEDRASTEAAVQEALAGTRPFDTEYRVVHPNGDVRHLRAAAAVVRDASGAPSKMLGMSFDVTDRTESELQLQQLVGDLKRINADVENFAYIAAHDLKAPLRGIDNLARSVAQDLGELVTRDIRDNFDLIHSRINRMTTLMDDLLAYLRAGLANGDVVEVDTSRLVRDIFDLAATTKAIRLEVDPALPILRTRRAPLDLVLRNLIGKAIKHHDKPHGTITVSARAIDEGYEFSVADDGPGISPEHQQRVFGMFQTIRSRDEIEGSGMGLAIVRKAVESMHGRITLESDGKHGCTFRFTWPAIAPVN